MLGQTLTTVLCDGLIMKRTRGEVGKKRISLHYARSVRYKVVIVMLLASPVCQLWRFPSSSLSPPLIYLFICTENIGHTFIQTIHFLLFCSFNSNVCNPPSSLVNLGPCKWMKHSQAWVRIAQYTIQWRNVYSQEAEELRIMLDNRSACGIKKRLKEKNIWFKAVVTYNIKRGLDLPLTYETESSFHQSMTFRACHKHWEG